MAEIPREITVKLKLDESSVENVTENAEKVTASLAAMGEAMAVFAAHAERAQASMDQLFQQLREEDDA